MKKNTNKNEKTKKKIFSNLKLKKIISSNKLSN